MKYLTQINSVMRSMLKDMFESIDDADFYTPLEGGGNSPGWILGHIVIGHRFGIAMLGGAAVPESELAMFGPGSKQPADTSSYPSKSHLLKAEHETGDAFVELCLKADATTLEQPREGQILSKELPLVGDMIGHLLSSHLSLHIGQLSAWRRARGMESVLKI